MLRFLRILRVLKLLQGQKLQNVKQYVDDFLVNPLFKTLLSFFKLFFIIITSAHWIACIFHLIRSEAYERKDDAVIFQSTLIL